MKILHVIAYYKPAYTYGGPIFSVGSLCEELSNSGHIVHVLTTIANGSKELNREPGRKYDVDGVEVRYYKRKAHYLSHFSPDLLLQLWEDAKKYDIIHISGWWNMVSVLGTLVCVCKGVRPIISMRGMLGPYSFQNGNVRLKKILHRLLGNYLLSRSILHATVKKELSEVAHVVNKVNGFVLPNFLDLPAYTPVERQNHEHVNFIYIGRIHHKKNLELLFEVLAAMYYSWHLNIAGSGELEYVNSLVKLSKQLGISDRIEWLGHLDSKEKFTALAESDIMILLSHAENFANTVVESLSVGTSVFISDQVGLAEYISEHEYGKVVQLNLTEAINGLNELVQNKELLLRTSEEAPIRVRRDFNGRKLIERYILEYRKICQN